MVIRMGHIRVAGSGQQGMTKLLNHCGVSNQTTTSVGTWCTECTDARFGSYMSQLCFR